MKMVPIDDSIEEQIGMSLRDTATGTSPYMIQINEVIVDEDK